jgi:hypothetical protein
LLVGKISNPKVTALSPGRLAIAAAKKCVAKELAPDQKRKAKPFLYPAHN